MNSRQRFQATIEHRQPDRTPIDLGATTLTAMSAPCQARLRAFLGFTEAPRLTNSGVDERILQWAGTDFRTVGTIVELPSPHSQRLSPTRHIDCWGIGYEEVGGYAQIVDSPLAGATREDLAAYPWPEARIPEELLARWTREAEAWARAGEVVVIAEHPFYGVLELGCWMCGYDEFLWKLAAEPDFVRDFFDRVFAIQCAVLEPYYTALGPYIDLTTSGDDFGMQQGPIVSPAMFRRLIAPYFTERIARTKALAGCLFWHHSCGSVYALLDDLLACGVDILNPIQTSAAGMDPATLKAGYGDRLVFWGGLDVQQFLPQATPDEVRAEVASLSRTLGKDGGYVLAPAHNIQGDVPPENIAAWVEAAKG